MKKYLIIIFIIIFTLVSGRILNIHAQTAAFSTNNESLNYCVGDTVSFVNESVDFDYVKWNFGNSYETYTLNPKHIYTSDGQYTVSLTAFKDDGTSNTAQIELNIQALPDLYIDIPADTFYSSSNIYVEASGSFDELLWSTGYTGNNLFITESGTYIVSATYSDSECSVSHEFTVFFNNSEKSENGIIIQNNILTPNSDGINDVLFIKDIDDIRPCEIIIYNRIGNIVYYNYDYQNNWAGESSGNYKLPTGTYYYLIKTESNPAKTGFIDIIREE